MLHPPPTQPCSHPYWPVARRTAPGSQGPAFRSQSVTPGGHPQASVSWSIKQRGWIGRSVLAGKCCQNQTPRTGYSIAECTFSQFWKLGVQDQGAGSGWFLVRPVFLACRWHLCAVSSRGLVPLCVPE